MKKLLLLTVILSLFLVLAAGANAALTVNNVELGSSTQERNQNLSPSVTLTITNTEADNVTITSITPSADSKFKLNITGLPSNTSVANGTSASVTVTFSAFVTKDLNAVNSNDASALKALIGTFTVSGIKASGPSITSSSATVTMQAENRLNIRKGKVKITSTDGTTREKTVNDGTKVTNVRPGDRLRFEFTVENRFSGRGDFDLDMDVDARLDTTDSSDYDFDDETDSLDIRADEDDTAVFSVDVEDDADRGTDSFTLLVTGKDDNGALHGEKIRFDVEIERESHDLVFRRADLTPSTLLCEGNRVVQVNTNILNRGRDDERRAGVELSVPAFSVSDKKADSDIDEDDDQSFTFTFQVPKDAKAGTYEVKLTSVYDATVKNNVKSLALTVEDCKKDQTPVQPPVVQPPVQPPQQNTTTVIPPSTPKTTGDATANVPRARVRESSFLDSNEYLMLLGVGVALVFVLLIALVAAAFRRR